MQCSAVQSSPVQSNPIQSNPIRSDPIRSDPIRSNPIQSTKYQHPHPPTNHAANEDVNNDMRNVGERSRGFLGGRYSTLTQSYLGVVRGLMITLSGVLYRSRHDRGFCGYWDFSSVMVGKGLLIDYYYFSRANTKSAEIVES